MGDLAGRDDGGDDATSSIDCSWSLGLALRRAGVVLRRAVGDAPRRGDGGGGGKDSVCQPRVLACTHAYKHASFPCDAIVSDWVAREGISGRATMTALAEGAQFVGTM